MRHCQPKPSLVLRIIAVSCAVVWLAGVSACSLEAWFGCDSHQHATAKHSDHDNSHAVAAADSEAHHDHDAEHHAADGDRDSHTSHKHDGKEGSCCLTLKAVAQTAKSITVPKQILQSLALLCVLLDEHIFALDTRDTASDRPHRRDE